MEVTRGDIVIVTFGEFGRPRPAVVVQANELGGNTTSVLVCPITSSITERLPIRPDVEPDTSNGLRAASQVMTDKIFAVPRNRIRSIVGKIDPSVQDQLDQALLVVLGLGR